MSTGTDHVRDELANIRFLLALLVFIEGFQLLAIAPPLAIALGAAALVVWFMAASIRWGQARRIRKHAETAGADSSGERS